jgi:hypothetical protein
LLLACRDCAKPRIISVMTAGDPIEIRTEHLPNTSLVHDLYASLLSVPVLTKGVLSAVVSDNLRWSTERQ